MKISKTILAIFALSLTLSSCGVVVESDSSYREPVNYLRYTIYSDRIGSAAEVLKSDCIDLDVRNTYGETEIEDLYTLQSLAFRWENNSNSISFMIYEDDEILSQTTYKHNYFSLNDVSQEARAAGGVDYKVVVERDDYCFR